MGVAAARELIHRRASHVSQSTIVAAAPSPDECSPRNGISIWARSVPGTGATADPQDRAIVIDSADLETGDDIIHDLSLDHAR